MVLFSITSWGQTTVFNETFGSAAVANPYTGGTSTAPSNVTYTVSNVGTNSTSGVMSSQVLLAGSNGYLFNPMVAGSSNAKYYLSTPYSSSLASTLATNTGKITWTVNMRTTRASVMGSNSQYNDSNSFGGVILCSTSSGPITSSGDGYAVVMCKFGTGTQTQNGIRLIKMVGGFPNGATTTTHPTLIQGAGFGTSPTNSFTYYKSVKVTYDPATGTWELLTRDDGATAFADPASGSYTTEGTSTDNTYTSTPMSTYGYFSSNNATSTGMQYDNYKIVLSPPPTAPLITFGTPFTSFTYEGSGPSATQSTVVTGANLTGPITINTSALTKYQISTDNFATVGTGTVTMASGGTLSVRLKAGLAAGTQNETITVASASDSYTKDIVCSGTVIGAYNYNGSGSLSDVNNWTPVPSAMTEAAAKFYISANATTDFVWALGASSIASVKDGATLTIADTFPITGQVNVLAASTLKVQADTYPTFGTIDATSNVHLQKQPAGNFSQNATFGNVFIDGGSLNAISFGSSTSGSTISGALSVNGTLTVAEDTDLNANSSVYNCFYINAGGKAIINGRFKQSRATNLVSFGAVRSTATGAPGIQFADAENAGVNFVLGANSTIEFSRGNSGTLQEITARSDYKNLTISDGTSGANNKTVSGTVNISKTLTLNQTFNGSFSGTGSFVLGNGATIVRTAGSFGTAVSITFGTSVNVIFDGTSALTSGTEIPTSTSVLNNLEIDNVAGVTLASTTAINNNLTLIAGNLATGDFLTLKSNATKTAVANPVLGTITGNVTVERYIPAGHRAYRLLSSPTTGGTLHTNWQEAQADGADVNIGFGTHLTGAGGNANGFDTTTTNAASIYSYSSGWNTLANTSGTLSAGSPFLVYVRGSRQASNITAAATNDATTLRTTGTLLTGTSTVTATATADAFTLIGNPYQAQVDMNKVLNTNATAVNLTQYYYFVDPSINSRGGYVTVDLTSPGAYQYLQPGQAFFVNTIASSPASLQFTEADKSDSAAQTSVFRIKNTTAPSLNITLLDGAANRLDNLKVVFDSNESNDVNQNDALKISNFDESMASSNSGKLLAIEKRANPTSTDEIPLNITKYRGTSYTMKLQGSGLTETPYLYDSFTSTTTEVPVDGTIDYAYTVDAGNAATTDASRFKLIYAKTLKTIDNALAGFAIYPNPSKSNSFNVMVPQSAGKVSLSVSNLLGQKLYTQNDIQAGASTVTVSTIKTAGIYLVSLTSESKTTTTKWIVQ